MSGYVYFFLCLSINHEREENEKKDAFHHKEPLPGHIMGYMEHFLHKSRQASNDCDGRLFAILSFGNGFTV